MQLESRIFSQQNEVTGGIKLSGFRLVLKFFIFFPETFNTTRCVNQFLFAGKKRMAFGAYFNADIGLGRSDLYLVATRTAYAGISVIRMNAVFHGIFNPLKLNVSECLSCHGGQDKAILQGFRIDPEDGTIESWFIYSEKKNMSITIFSKRFITKIETDLHTG